MSVPRMSLPDMIVDLRQDLREAQKRAAQQDLTFQVLEIELEVQVTRAKEGEAKGGVNFWVCSAEAGGKLSQETAHTLRLKLKPLSGQDGSKQPLEISDVDERPGP